MKDITQITPEKAFEMLYSWHKLPVTLRDYRNRITQYFRLINTAGIAPTFSGLALFLGCSSREQMQRIASDGEFSVVVSSAMLAVQTFYEQKLSEKNSAGAIFALKNYGWNDTQTFSVDAISQTDVETKACQLAALKAMRECNDKTE